MSITQFAFIGLAMAKHKVLGISYDVEKMMAMCHFWRVVCHMLGVAEEYNLCSAEDLQTIMSRCDAVVNHIVVPALMHLPPNFEEMATAMLNGLWCVSPDIEPKKFIFYTMKLSGVPGYYLDGDERKNQLEYLTRYPQYIADANAVRADMDGHLDECSALSKFSWWQRLDIRITEYMLRNLIAKYSFWNKLFNQVILMRLFFLKHFPYLAIYKFGPRAAYVRVQLDETDTAAP